MGFPGNFTTRGGRLKRISHQRQRTSGQGVGSWGPQSELACSLQQVGLTHGQRDWVVCPRQIPPATSLCDSGRWFAGTAHSLAPSISLSTAFKRRTQTGKFQMILLLGSSDEAVAPTKADGATHHHDSGMTPYEGWEASI